MICAVIDTNIALYGLLWWGQPAKLLARAQAGEFQILDAESMIFELIRVINSCKFKKRFEELDASPEEALTFYKNLVVFCKQPTKLKIKCKEPDDLIFIELVVAESAHFIVSGNSHLLDLQTVKGIPTLNSRESHQLLDEIQ